MKGEIPECRRCCCCLPLRYGLLAWGYFKMTADAFLIACITYSLISTVMSINDEHPLHGMYVELGEHPLHGMYVELGLAVVVLGVFLTDFVVTIMFIVGGHKKNWKLIRVFYHISTAMLIISFLLSVTYFILIILYWMDSYSWLYRMMEFTLHVLVLVVQTYFLFLLRSEIKKLQNIGEFRYVNNAAEAECTMKCEEIAAEKVTYTQRR